MPESIGHREIPRAFQRAHTALQRAHGQGRRTANTQGDNIMEDENYVYGMPELRLARRKYSGDFKVDEYAFVSRGRTIQEAADGMELLKRFSDSMGW